VSLRIGVLALQGDFAEHAAVLRRIGAEPVEVRLPADLAGLDGLIIPGGESTTISRLLAMYGLLEPVRQRAQSGLPVLGTCAGAIVMANKAVGLTLENLHLMDIEVRRNAFGRQVDSFEVELPMPEVGTEPVHAVFIRAPIIAAVGPDVQVLGKLADGTVVAARQDNLVAISFHPELTQDTRFHEYFLRLAAERRQRGVEEGARA